MSRIKATRMVPSAIAANMKFFGVDLAQVGALSAANSNSSPSKQSGLGSASEPETQRLLRAFNSIENNELRRLVIRFVESTAGRIHLAMPLD